MDKQFTQKLADYMQQPYAERDIEQGATMLLQLNGNRILYRNIITRPQVHRERLMYYLDKFLRERIMQECKISEKSAFSMQEPEQVTTLISAFKKPQRPYGFKGQRADHDALPEEIKSFWVENGTIRKYKCSLHEKSKAVKTDEERKPVIAELVRLDRKYYDNWKKYDSYKKPEVSPVVSPDVPTDGTPSQPGVPDVDVKKVSAARKYLSENKTKLATLADDPVQLVKCAELRAKMQQRIDYLVSCNQTLSDEQKAELLTLGLNV